MEPPCAEPGSAAGYIEGNGFGAKNVTITVGGVEAEVLAATGHDASFVVPEGLSPGPVEVVVMNPGGRIATINWVVCSVPDTDPPVLTDFDFNPKQVDISTQDQVVTCTMTVTDTGGAGVDHVTCSLLNPSDSRTESCGSNSPSSGDEFNGTYECDVTIPQGSELGAWSASVFLEEARSREALPARQARSVRLG